MMTASLPLLAQERQADTLQQIKRNLLKVYSETEVFNLGTLDSSAGKAYDTSLNLYQRFNPVYAGFIAWQDQSAAGSPVLDLSKPIEQGSGFRLGPDALAPWWFSAGAPEYFTSPLAVTDLHYAQGPPNMLYLEALHTQNVRAGWNVGVQYRHTAANNLYFDNLPRRDRTRMVSLFSTRLFSHYVRSDSLYIATMNVYFDRNSLQESGGLVSTNRFEANPGRLREFNNFARLTNAVNRFNRNLLSFRQSFINRLPITHHITIGRQMNRFDYISDGNEFIPEPIFSDVTFDSLRHFYLTNEVSTDLNLGRWFLRSSLSHDYHSLAQTSANTISSQGRYNNLSYHIALRSGNEAKNAGGIQWEQFVSGFNAGDYMLNGRYTKNITGHHLKLEGLLQSRRPDFLANFFQSNHYLWDRSELNKEQILSTKARFDAKTENFGFEACLMQVNQRVYFDTSGLPLQSNVPWRFVQFKSIFNLDWGWLSGKPELLYQYQNLTLSGIPEFAIKVPLAFNFTLFDQNLKVQTGADVWAHSGFELNYYNPVTRRFQLSAHETGWQLRVNAFVNLQVKTVRAFIMYERLNDLSGLAIYSAAFMPDMPAQLRFGIGWMLFN